jgi:DNA-binding PadR family transcriptional regulator
VKTLVGEPTSERGGKSKRYYKITQKGFQALEEVQRLTQSMRTDLPKPALE